jgi:cytochrome c556
MDDQFLHQLRRDPPAGFAIRLKWQLDRPVPTRPSRARLLLVFAIFGTAFALVSPQARRAFGDLFHELASIPPTPTGASGLATAPRADSADISADANRPHSAAPSPNGFAVAHSAGQQVQPSDRPDGRQPVTAGPQPVGEPFLGLVSVSTQNSLAQTREQRAQATVETRQALFRLLSLVTVPLASMQRGLTPVDLQVARTSAHRLSELSSMIPEVFLTDTRGFDVHTLTLDLVWTQSGDFDSKADALTLAAAELEGAIAAQDTTATLEAIRRIQTACSACHNSYRRKP